MDIKKSLEKDRDLDFETSYFDTTRHEIYTNNVEKLLIKDTRSNRILPIDKFDNDKEKKTEKDNILIQDEELIDTNEKKVINEAELDKR